MFRVDGKGTSFCNGSNSNQKEEVVKIAKYARAAPSRSTLQPLQARPSSQRLVTHSLITWGRSEPRSNSVPRTEASTKQKKTERSDTCHLHRRAARGTNGAVRSKTHRLRVYRHFLAETDSRRQIVVMQLDPAGFAFHSPVITLKRISLCGYSSKKLFGVGAQEKTRTSTALRPQVPETCASTNSATWARRSFATGDLTLVRRWTLSCQRHPQF